MEKIIKRTHCLHDAGITVKRDATGERSRIIEGYAIRFNSRSVPFLEDEHSRVVEVISPEAVSADFLRSQDIKMTLYHDMSRLLARSKRGEGTLDFEVDDEGVKFRFEAPETTDGEDALKLVERGDIDGCSFMFGTFYDDRDYVSREVTNGADGKREIVYTVRKIMGLYDFTLTPDPAYPETTVSAAKRDLSELEKPEKEEKEEEKEEDTPEDETPEEEDKEPEKRQFNMQEYLHLINLSK